MCASRESVNSLGQESNSWAVKEGGLTSIRDDESEGECRHIPALFVIFPALSQCSLCLYLCHSVE